MQQHALVRRRQYSCTSAYGPLKIPPEGTAAMLRTRGWAGCATWRQYLPTTIFLGQVGAVLTHSRPPSCAELLLGGALLGCGLLDQIQKLLPPAKALHIVLCHFPSARYSTTSSYGKGSTTGFKCAAMGRAAQLDSDVLGEVVSCLQ